MSRQFTPIEVNEIAKAEEGLRQAGLDVDHEGAAHNANLILDHFQKHPTLPVTLDSIYRFVEANKQQHIWRNPAQQEYDRIARENPPAAAAVTTWLATQGKVEGQLVNVGDEAFENASLLLTELRGRDVNLTTIYQAIGRLNHRVGRKLHFVPKPSKQVDPSYRPGRFIEDYNKTPIDYEHERRAAFADKQESQATISKREQTAAKHEAEKLRSGYSHAEDEQVSKLFVTDPQTREIDWIATKNARLAMLERFANRRATRFLVS